MWIRGYEAFLLDFDDSPLPPAACALFDDDSPLDDDSLAEPDSDFFEPDSLEEPEDSEPESEDPLELPPADERALEPVRESLR